MRLIDADETIDKLYYFYNGLYGVRRIAASKAIDIVTDMPEVDAQPIIHAHVIINWLGDCRCSNCGDGEINCTKKYCHNCGARFDEQEVKED